MIQAISNLIIALFGLSRVKELKPCGTIDIHKASSILLDKLEEMGDDKAEIYLPDNNIKIYRKDEVKNSQLLIEVANLSFRPEKHDCDDFAANLFGKFAGLVWTNKHALNWFIDENGTHWWIEPQTRELSRNLQSWQGWDVRFLLGR